MDQLIAPCQSIHRSAVAIGRIVVQKLHQPTSALAHGERDKGLVDG